MGAHPSSVKAITTIAQVQTFDLLTHRPRPGASPDLHARWERRQLRVAAKDYIFTAYGTRRAGHRIVVHDAGNFGEAGCLAHRRASVNLGKGRPDG
jgi:hypothetical protein